MPNIQVDYNRDQDTIHPDLVLEVRSPTRISVKRLSKEAHRRSSTKWLWKSDSRKGTRQSDFREVTLEKWLESNGVSLCGRGCSDAAHSVVAVYNPATSLMRTCRSYCWSHCPSLMAPRYLLFLNSLVWTQTDPHRWSPSLLLNSSRFCRTILLDWSSSILLPSRSFRYWDFQFTVRIAMFSIFCVLSWKSTASTLIYWHAGEHRQTAGLIWLDASEIDGELLAKLLKV